ncbi:hypothetical protein B0H14DRAFT_3488846 [Mycena olivaceomarginata]|nr:hypothetical protein B0H14DRAFT_3488846 [Mycena olivaceomarginata]
MPNERELYHTGAENIYLQYLQVGASFPEYPASWSSSPTYATLSLPHSQLPVEPRRVPHIFKTFQPEKRKKQIMACFFCRERKIACRRLEEGNSDQTCQ